MSRHSFEESWWNISRYAFEEYVYEIIKKLQRQIYYQGNIIFANIAIFMHGISYNIANFNFDISERHKSGSFYCHWGTFQRQFEIAKVLLFKMEFKKQFND